MNRIDILKAGSKLEQLKEATSKESPIIIKKKSDTLYDLFADDDDNHGVQEHNFKALEASIKNLGKVCEEAYNESPIIIKKTGNDANDESKRQLVPTSMKMKIKKDATNEPEIVVDENYQTNPIVKPNFDFSLGDLQFESDEDEPQADNAHNENKAHNQQLDKIKLECQINSPSTSMDKKSNSTSTPRSILKNKVKASISSSPLVLMPTQNKVKKEIHFEINEPDFHKEETKTPMTPSMNVSLVGITQALALLNSPAQNTSIKCLEFDRIQPFQACFDMKSTLDDLFAIDDLLEAEEVTMSNSKAKSKLRFDEASISMTKKSDSNCTVNLESPNSVKNDSSFDSFCVKKKVIHL